VLKLVTLSGLGMEDDSETKSSLRGD